MSNTPRTNQYWPKMKVRGKRNRRMAPWRRLYRSFEEITLSAEKVAHTFERMLLVSGGPVDPDVDFKKLFK